MLQKLARTSINSPKEATMINRWVVLQVRFILCFVLTLLNIFNTLSPFLYLDQIFHRSVKVPSRNGAVKSTEKHGRSDLRPFIPSLSSPRPIRIDGSILQGCEFWSHFFQHWPFSAMDTSKRESDLCRVSKHSTKCKHPSVLRFLSSLSLSLCDRLESLISWFKEGIQQVQEGEVLQSMAKR